MSSACDNVVLTLRHRTATLLPPGPLTPAGQAATPGPYQQRYFYHRHQVLTQPQYGPWQIPRVLDNLNISITFHKLPSGSQTKTKQQILRRCLVCVWRRRKCSALANTGDGDNILSSHTNTLDLATWRLDTRAVNQRPEKAPTWALSSFKVSTGACFDN